MKLKIQVTESEEKVKKSEWGLRQHVSHKKLYSSEDDGKI
jgi:hypothetical protein